MLAGGGVAEKERKSLKVQREKLSKPERTVIRFKGLIFGRSKRILSEKEMDVVCDFLERDGMQMLVKPSHHRFVWLKCSGAYNLMLQNPGYYELLVKN